MTKGARNLNSWWSSCIYLYFVTSLSKSKKKRRRQFPARITRPETKDACRRNSQVIERRKIPSRNLLYFSIFFFYFACLLQLFFLQNLKLLIELFKLTVRWRMPINNNSNSRRIFPFLTAQKFNWLHNGLQFQKRGWS